MATFLVISGVAAIVVAIVVPVGVYLHQRAESTRLADEARSAREEELAIERERLRAEMEERLARMHAEITAVQGGSRNDGALNRAYDFTLTNLGPSWAKHVSAYLVQNDDKVISGETLVGPLDQGQSKEATLIVLLGGLAEAREVGVRLWVKWSDLSGRNHTEESNVVVTL